MADIGGQPASGFQSMSERTRETLHDAVDKAKHFAHELKEELLVEAPGKKYYGAEMGEDIRETEDFMLLKHRPTNKEP
uniref:Uncharacterized protein n=1 Tax=Plectus sambesii TaxID=2011161 RepID=A0A914UU53_9BILA